MKKRAKKQLYTSKLVCPPYNDDRIIEGKRFFFFLALIRLCVCVCECAIEKIICF